MVVCRWAELESGATTIAFTPLHQRETDGLSGEVQLPDAAAARGPVEVCFVYADVDVTLADRKTIQASGKAPFALLDRGDIKARFLPVVAQRTQLTYETVTRGQFNYLTA